MEFLTGIGFLTAERQEILTTLMAVAAMDVDIACEILQDNGWQLEASVNAYSMVKAKTGQQLCEAADDGDAAKVSTLLSTQGAVYSTRLHNSLLSTQGAQSFINYQDALRATPLQAAAAKGHAAVTNMLIAAHCNVNLQSPHGYTAAPLCGRKWA
jgi:hypothetical protein